MADRWLDHNIFLVKLRNYNFSENALKWIQSYLTGRSMTVNINGTYSERSEMISGVPRMSCLGRLHFSLFINDLPSILTIAYITIYADDSTPYIYIYNSKKFWTDM